MIDSTITFRLSGDQWDQPDQSTSSLKQRYVFDGVRVLGVSCPHHQAGGDALTILLVSETPGLEWVIIFRDIESRHICQIKV